MSLLFIYFYLQHHQIKSQTAPAEKLPLRAGMLTDSLLLVLWTSFKSRDTMVYLLDSEAKTQRNVKPLRRLTCSFHWEYTVCDICHVTRVFQLTAEWETDPLLSHHGQSTGINHTVFEWDWMMSTSHKTVRSCHLFKEPSHCSKTQSIFLSTLNTKYNSILWS